MSKMLILIPLLGVAMIWRACADEAKTNHWGPLVCDAQMSIRLKEPEKQIKTNDPVIALILVRNASTTETIYFWKYSLPPDFFWTVTSPSGKDLSPKLTEPQDTFSTMMVRIGPNQEQEFEYELHLICSFNEVGTYKVAAKKLILVSRRELKKCEIVSNTGNIAVSK